MEGWLAALGLDGSHWSAPFFAQEHGQRPLLALRIAVLFVALVRVRGDARPHTFALAVMGALFVLSLAFRGALVADVLVSALLILRFGDREARAAPTWLAAAALASPLALALVPSGSAPVVAAPNGSPAEVIAAWRARGNLFHAHAAALEWANTEAVPGEGYLALAEIDRDIGQPAKAHKVLEKILANPASEAVRQAALDDERGWNLP